MPYIFDGIRYMSDDELKIEIALLKKINFVNVAKSVGNRALGTVADITNSLIRSFSKDSSWDYKALEVADMVRKEFDLLKNMSRPLLMLELKRQIAVKCGVPSDEAELVSDKYLSVLMCKEAAKLYNIEKYSTIAYKIEQIRIQYNTDFYNSLHSKMISQDKEQIQIWDKKMQQRLDAISIEDKRELQSKLFPKEFSGRGIGKILRTERGTKYLSMAVPIIGLEGFDYISAYVGAAIRSIMSFTKISQSVMAQIIWRAACVYPAAFSVDIHILPSYIPSEEKSQSDAMEIQFRQLLKKRVSLEKEIAKLKSITDKNEEQINAINEKLSVSNKELQELQEKYQKLEKQKAEYIDGKHTEYDTKKYYSEVNETNRQITNNEAAISKQERKLQELRKKQQELMKESEVKKADLLDIRVQTDTELVTLSKKIKDTWSKLFTEFTFADDIYGQVSITFMRDDRLKLEEMLYEMMLNGEIDAYDSKTGVVMCLVTNNMIAQICHEGNHITSIERHV